MQLQVHSKVGARFKLIVRKASDDSIARETDWFHNLVLDTGLNRMSVGTWINRCCVGAGNSTPVATQVALDSFLASTTNSVKSSSVKQTSATPYFYGVRNTWRFEQGVAAGNISEIGLGWGDTSLWNRALVKDLNGNPTTITVLADEYLDVISEIRNYVGSGTGQFNLKNKLGEVVSVHNYTYIPSIGTPNSIFNEIRFGRASFFSGDINNNVNGIPSGGETTVNNHISNSYLEPRSVSVSLNLPLGVAQFQHKSLLLAHNMLTSDDVRYQIQIDPPITKTSTQVMTYTFELSWDRYEPT